MPRGTKWTKRKQAVFLDVTRMTGSVSAGARAAGVPRNLVYGRRREDRVFAAEWDAALECALDDLEGALRKRAVEGVEKAVFYGGKQCGSSVSYSDNLGMFLLRGRRKEVFGDGKAAPESDANPEPDKAHISPRERLLEKLSGMTSGAPEAVGENT